MTTSKSVVEKAANLTRDVKSSDNSREYEICSFGRTFCCVTDNYSSLSLWYYSLLSLLMETFKAKTKTK